MKNHLMFNSLHFDKMSFDEFKQNYHGLIRTNIVWDKLNKRKVSTGIKEIDYLDNCNYYIAWYRDGNWRDGKPRKISCSYDDGNLSLVRVPALKINEKDFLILDGLHRLTELRPRFIIIDYLELKDKKLFKYFTDMYNEELRELIEEEN